MGTIPFSIKVANYKCFGDEPQGFELIKPINIIIGRNNSGKSALIDAVQQACRPQPEFRTQDSPPGKTAKLVYSTEADESLLRNIFKEGMRGGAITNDHWHVGKRYLGRKLVFEQANGQGDNQRTMHVADLGVLYSSEENHRNLEARIASQILKPWQGRSFRRVAAERDVTPEQESNEIDPQPRGQRVTNLIHNISNLERYDREIVDDALLNALNEITAPDYAFSSILARRRDDNSWEVFLREASKGLVAISASGSGLKTILCVLANVVLWPLVSTNKTLKSYIFGFEELENSLHPALLRRLLLYLCRRVRKEDAILLLTTHSSVAIDMFAADDDAQIIHTVHLSGTHATATTVSEYLQRRNILDDIDVRASDLLQSNGIIWVEGPSDRIYINRWIGLLTNNRIREGTHYQCVFYGGKLLAHLSADAPQEVDALVSIFRVNKNAAVIIDSDRGNERDELNPTKRRIVEEMAGLKGYAWVTHGREIENYLPVGAINGAAGLGSGRSLGQFEDISAYLVS